MLRASSTMMSASLPGLRVPILSSSRLDAASAIVAISMPCRPVTDLGDRLVLPARTVDESHVRPVVAVSLVGCRIDHNCRTTDVVVVQRRAERTGELPAGVLGTGGRRSWPAAKAERHELVLRAEVRLRDAAD